MKTKFLIWGVFVIFIISISIIYYTQNDSDNKEGILSLTFDDGYLTQYETAYPLMKGYGFNGTAYIIVEGDTFEGRELISFEQAREMQNNGWEIGSHTLDHSSLTNLDEKEIEEQLNLSKQILEDNEFLVSSIAFPFGDYNEEIILETKKYYSSSRPLLWGYNNLSEINFYELKSKWLVIEKSPEEVCSWINHTKENDLWLILIFHYIGQEERPFDTSVEEFKEILKCINSSGIKIKTIKEVIESNGK